MNSRERLQGVNRTLDALGAVVASLEAIDPGAKGIIAQSTPAGYKTEAQVHMGQLRSCLNEWANYERERLA